MSSPSSRRQSVAVEAAAILREARAVIERRGWARGVSWDPRTGRVDILGAVAVAAGCSPKETLTSPFPLAHAPIARRVGALTAWEALDATLDEDPVEWNDALERTEQQVAHLLISVATILEASAH